MNIWSKENEIYELFPKNPFRPKTVRSIRIYRLPRCDPILHARCKSRTRRGLVPGVSSGGYSESFPPKIRVRDDPRDIRKYRRIKRFATKHASTIHLGWPFKGPGSRFKFQQSNLYLSFFLPKIYGTNALEHFNNEWSAERNQHINGTHHITWTIWSMKLILFTDIYYRNSKSIHVYR